MERICAICGGAMPTARSQKLYCSSACKNVAWGKNGPARMQARPVPTPGCGSHTERLADVPLRKRLDALARLIELGELTEEEIPLAFSAVIDPGHLGTRVV